ncbi:Uncharacterized protein DBV15_04040 [Temnothorax longispinosus]|uniref:Uncharacterized protein n=1 Tax=Temnothorax longispinosus TaxID=300112 RepID=A0A4S2KBG3_9HYME|nr:Uncharacterized protein DBV15_04040 [Temnothorax longispinosus]
MESMDARLVAQALNYHGQQLQKVWEGERNENELVMLNLKDPSFEIYQQRQKTLSFGDRGKRLKLQQFLTKKADDLYDKANLEKSTDCVKQEMDDEEFYATVPALDTFVTMEKSQRIRNFLEALILNTATVPAVDKKGVTRGYMANDLVCVVVSEVNVEAERVVAVMNVPAREGQAPHPPMGLIHSDDLPEAYKKAIDNKGQSYEALLENSTGFNNPNNIKYLCDLIGLGQQNHSNMVGLRERFAPNEYASELRQTQASKWAFRSVAEGIDHFKAGRHSEAFQCLNKALTVDPRNVEGLVARGALYANSGSFKKAIEDFETALKLNQTHANARKYMAETLVALGRSYEDEKKYEDAQKAYENCLAIAPYHEEARNSIEYIKSKTLTASLNPLDTFKSFEAENDGAENKKDKKKRKKERKSRSKKRQRWSSSSSSSSTGSSTSSSSDSSSSSSSGSSRSASRSPNRKRKHKKDHRSSLSPLSKRMAQYNNPPAATTTTHDPIAPTSYPTNTREKMDDYESKVRKFLEETARWKREREKEKKHSESEKMKKKKKKEKKGKDKEKEDKKSRKKKKKEERKKRKNKDKLERDLEALKKSSLPDLEQLESKLNAYYAKVEKDCAALKSDRSYSPDPMRKVDEAKEKINKMLEGGDDVEHQQGGTGGSSTVPPNKRQAGPLSEGEERDDDDYERWGEGEGGDAASAKNEGVKPVGGNLEGKEFFIERMKQRSKNVLMQRAIAAKIW